MTRIVDLSAPIETSPPGTSDFQRNSVDYFDHAAGAAEIERLTLALAGAQADAQAARESDLDAQRRARLIEDACRRLRGAYARSAARAAEGSALG